MNSEAIMFKNQLWITLIRSISKIIGIDITFSTSICIADPFAKNFFQEVLLKLKDTLVNKDFSEMDDYVALRQKYVLYSCSCYFIMVGAFQFCICAVATLTALYFVDYKDSIQTSAMAVAILLATHSVLCIILKPVLV